MSSGNARSSATTVSVWPGAISLRALSASTIGMGHDFPRASMVGIRSPLASEEQRDLAWRRGLEELGRPAVCHRRIVDQLFGLQSEQVHAHRTDVDLDAELLRELDHLLYRGDALPLHDVADHRRSAARH